MKTTSKPIALLIVAIVGAFALSGLWMTYDLIRIIFRSPKIEPAALGTFVALIASISGLTGVAIGYVGGTLNNTEKQTDGLPLTKDSQGKPALNNVTEDKP